VQVWVAGGLGFGVAVGLLVLLWPRFGLLARWREATRAARRERVEDALKYLYDCELGGTVAGLASVAGALHWSGDEAVEVLQGLERRQLIELGAEGIRLTAAGRELGLNVLRAHRLWESYLADRTGFPEAEWHGRAHSLEHGLTAAEVDALSARLQHPTHDPHGDPIPTAAGEVAGPRGIAPAAAPLGKPLRIVHIEDEPAAIYAQLVAVGLQPGMVVRLAESTPQRMRLIAGVEEHVLAPLVAASLAVEVLDEAPVDELLAGEPLSALRPGESGRVVAISRRCHGAARRRMMDLGVLPGTTITAELRSPSGDPTAYRVREALIALRAEQAQLIRVERVPAPAAA
jgi:DtxR family transcriptional regulator, Mn-dependent transcriptional regulator